MVSKPVSMGGLGLALKMDDGLDARYSENIFKKEPKFIGRQPSKNDLTFRRDLWRLLRILCFPIFT